MPVADGGEGTVDCFLYALNCEKVPVSSTGPYGEPVEVYYGKVNATTAVMEMAMCAGLPQVKDNKNPELTTTYGVGTMMRHAVENGCKEIVIGLGGSCTNDGGTGLAAALGVKFYDAAGKEFVPNGKTMGDVAKIDKSEADKLLAGVKISVMCDIDNPMYGPMGAAYVFAPQKGADEEMVKRLDGNLVKLSEAIKNSLGIDVSTLPGSGAAGAAGAGIAAFLGGSLKSGIQTVLDLIGFDDMLDGTDLVFTGEGRIDSQSLGGKVISGIAGRAKKKDVPVIAVVGSIGDGAEGAYDLGVASIFSINQKAEAFETAQYKSKENLTAAMDNIIRFCKTCEKIGK